MTQQEKELLLKDLCARLPYGVKVKTPYDNAFMLGIVKRSSVKKQGYTDFVTNRGNYPVSCIKPYLRSMSSMTEEEAKDYNLKYVNSDIVDWLNAHHFDYRGLIEKNLALEAPEGMYNKL